MSRHNSVVRATTGVLATISNCYPDALYKLFYQHGRLVNKIHMGEGFAHFMQ